MASHEALCSSSLSASCSLCRRRVSILHTTLFSPNKMKLLAVTYAPLSPWELGLLTQAVSQRGFPSHLPINGSCTSHLGEKSSNKLSASKPETELVVALMLSNCTFRVGEKARSLFSDNIHLTSLLLGWFSQVPWMDSNTGSVVTFRYYIVSKSLWPLINNYYVQYNVINILIFGQNSSPPLTWVSCQQQESFSGK